MLKPVYSDYRLLLAGWDPAYVKEVTNAIAKCGLRVKLVGGNAHKNTQFKGRVEFVNLRGDYWSDIGIPRKIYSLFVNYCKLIGYIVNCKSRVVYDLGVGNHPLLRCFLVYCITRIIGKKIISTVHNIVPHDGDSLRNRVIFFVIYRFASNYLVVHGKALKERLIKEFGVSDKKIIVVPLGSFHPLDSPAITKGIARKNLGIDDDEFVLLSFGLQRYYKGTHFLLKALSDYSRRFRLLIRGKTWDDAYCEMLKNIIKENNLSYKVDSAFTYATDQEMELVFKAADIVVLPYFEGSQSAVKLMAYSYGRPVLVSDIGGLSEYVLLGKTGETFRAKDSDSFLRKLDKMWNNLDSYNEQFIKDYTYTNLSWDICAHKVNRIYELFD